MYELSSGGRADSTTLVTNDCLGVGPLFRPRRSKSACQTIRDTHGLFAQYRCSLLHHICQLLCVFFLHNGHTDLRVACGELGCVYADMLYTSGSVNANTGHDFLSVGKKKTTLSI